MMLLDQGNIDMPLETAQVVFELEDSMGGEGGVIRVMSRFY